MKRKRGVNTYTDLITNENVVLDFIHRRARKIFSRGERIAVKLHMGEPGNRHFIKPSLTKRVIGVLLETGCRPFIFDSPVVYRSQRNNERGYLQSAADHGYSEHNIGAPIVISNRSSPVKGTHMDFEICAEPLEADGVFLLTHVKGHIACGMGGTIKNIGMGCMSKETKGAIHEGGEPIYTEGCTQCSTCVGNCPTNNIRIVDDHPQFDATWCPGCSNCVLVCPEKCIRPRLATFDDHLAEAAVLAHERFKKVYAVNVLKEITKLCDCVANSGPVILEDIGYVCGTDMLSVDIAALEIIAESSGREDLFSDHNRRSPWGHIRAAAQLMKRNLTVSIRRTA